MSSKSRKKTPRQDSRKQAAAGAETATQPEPKGGLDIPDELVHVPKETSKLRFVLMILLVIVLLIIFVIPQAMFGAFGSGGRGEETVVSWDLAAGGRTEISAFDFQVEHQTFSRVLALDPLLMFSLGITDREPTAEQMARLLVLEDLALAAGIRISDTDLRDHIRSMLEFSRIPVTSYRQVAARRGGTAVVESTIRRAMRAQRYLQLVAYMATLPDPSQIEELWAADHVEFAFDYVELGVADLEEEVRGSIPDDATLTTWWDEQPEEVRLPLQKPERRAAQFVRFVDPTTTPAAALREAFPEPEGADPEARAEEYYNKVFFARFLRPKEEPEAADPAPESEEGTSETEGSDDEPQEEPAGDGGQGGDGSQDDGNPEGQDEAAAEEQDSSEGTEPPAEDPQADEEAPQTTDDPGATDVVPPAIAAPPPDPYLSLDEVREQCLAEAPTYFAMNAWLQKLQERQAAGETIDLVAEAEAMGLELLNEAEPRSREEWAGNEDLGGFTTASTVFQTQAEAFGLSLIVNASSISIVRVAEVIEPYIPPFDEIPVTVRNQWVEQRTGELALEKLQGIFDGFPEAVRPEKEEEEETAFSTSLIDDLVIHEADGTAFQTAVEAAGLEIQRRDWLDKSGFPTDDPDWEKAGHIYLRSKRELHEFEENWVMEPGLNPEGDVAYLVRVSGKREMPLDRMSPQNYQNYKRRTAFAAAETLRTGYSIDFLKEHHGLELAFGGPAEEAEQAGTNE